MRVDALIISDIHLGSKGCNAEKLLETLKKYGEPKSGVSLSPVEVSPEVSRRSTPRASRPPTPTLEELQRRHLS